MQYQEYKDGIANRLNSVAEDFFTVGYYLRKISDHALFLEDGYKSIWEFAKGEYNLSMSSASRFMAINARFSIDDGEHMEQRYIGMGVSKLQEMLGLPDEELEKVTKETTVREIRAIKAAMKPEPEPLSYFGLPKTVRPEGSLLTTPGCGGGKYSCFSCFRECGIRQEPRQCRTSPLGNPQPCDRVNNEKWKKNISYSLYRNECQLLHPQLAPIREGDREPDPCCLTCKNRATCYSCCDVAKKAHEDEVRARQAEEQKRLREQEAKKPEPTPEEIKLLYDYWHVENMANITAEALKAEHNYSGGNPGRLRDYKCTSRGVRINYKRELTWAQIAKEFKEIRQDAGKIKAMPKELVPAPDPEIIDVEFTEVEDGSESIEEARNSPDPAETNRDEEEPEEEEQSPQRANKEPKNDPEYYRALDVSLLLIDYRRDLKEFRAADCPPSMIRKQRILVDALSLLNAEKEREEQKS